MAHPKDSVSFWFQSLPQLLDLKNRNFCCWLFCLEKKKLIITPRNEIYSPNIINFLYKRTRLLILMQRGMALIPLRHNFILGWQRKAHQLSTNMKLKTWSEKQFFFLLFFFLRKEKKNPREKLAPFSCCCTAD